AGFGGVNGTWDTATFWNTNSTGAAAGPYVASPTSADDLYITSGTTGTITIASNGIGSSLTISDNQGVTITGGTLNLGGSGAQSGLFITAAETKATAVSSLLSLNGGTNVIQNSGAGALTVSN